MKMEMESMTTGMLKPAEVMVMAEETAVAETVGDSPIPYDRKTVV